MSLVNLSDNDQSLQYASVRAGETGVAEMDGQRPIVFVPRAEIHNLELHYASGAERPLVTILLGLVVLLVSLTPLLFLLGVLYFGGHMELKLLYILALAPLGLWLLRFGLKRRYVLVVHTSKGKRKAVFQGPVDKNHARDFMSQISSRYGYIVSVNETAESRR